MTDLLLQCLAERHRRLHPEENRTQRFVAVTGEPVIVPAGHGAYTCAIRFVRSDTGQASPLVAIGVVEVG